MMAFLVCHMFGEFSPYPWAIDRGGVYAIAYNKEIGRPRVNAYRIKNCGDKGIVIWCEWLTGNNCRSIIKKKRV